MRVPSTTSVRCDRVSMVEILNISHLLRNRLRKLDTATLLPKAGCPAPWQPLESIGHGGSRARDVSKNVEVKIDNCRDIRSSKRPSPWRPTYPKDINLCSSRRPDRKAPRSTLGRRGRLNCSRLGKLRGTAQVRQIVLHRNRRGRGSLPSAAESNPRSFYLSVESAQKCQHEQDRNAANAHEECN
jgi:hypothetical protein